MYRDKRNNNTETLKEAMEKLLASYKLNKKYSETEIVQSWSKIMGIPIANRTDNLFMHKGILYVTLNSAPLRHEMQHSKDKVLELIRKEFGSESIIDIVFK